MGEGRGDHTDGVLGRRTGGGSHLAGGGPHPEGKGDYRGIGLVEVMWKVVAVILNRRLTSSITFHDVLHGFRAGRGTGNATLEAKLLQQLAAMR